MGTVAASASLGDASSPRRVPLKHVFAVFVGNGLEFYDFLTFSYFAVYIGKVFFPADSTFTIYISRVFFPSYAPSTSLLLSLFTFGIGFLTRPIGAIVIGRMGDRIGRKPAMLLSFSLMGAAIIGLALTPSYAQIGNAAPILVVLFRLLQGFALGGEVGPTTAYMAESAPPHRRGLYLSMQYATQDSAALLAGVFAVVLANYLSAAQLQDWGWRAVMIVGALIVPFGIMVRRTLPETLHAADDAALAPDATRGTVSLRTRIRPFLAITILGLMMLTAGTIGSYSINYMTTYALDTLKLSAAFAFGVTVINGGLSVIFEPISGWLSDKFGRKVIMITPGILLALAIFPCFWIIDHFRTWQALYGAETVMVILASLSSVPVIVTITEQLPPSIRSGAVATIYAFAISIFGGSTQFMIKWLISATGNPLAPAYYWTGAMLLGLVAMMLVKESAPAKIAKH
ncbi:MAG: MFS transporter [Proteobacteria bacterium]|nr:MFS transporter [Pseudomonadota bacterium]